MASVRTLRRAGAALRRRLPTRRDRVVAGALAALLVAGLTWWVWPAPAPFTRTERVLTVASGPGGATPTPLDTAWYLPRGASASAQVPALLLAHGFGGTKDSVRADAEEFARAGYAVLTWTARGFGASGGRIHLNDADHEVRDAQRLLDWVAAQPQVRRDGATDPRVGVVGSSYGGALALSLAAADRRVDATVPMITWNDLARAFFPQSAGAGPGVYKKAWAALLFGRGGALAASASAGTDAARAGAGADGTSTGTDGTGTGADEAGAGAERDGGAAGPDATPAPGAEPGEGLLGGDGAAGPGGAGGDPACGRFAADVCAVYLRVGVAGQPDPAGLARLRRANPDVRAVRAPTLLVQGSLDTLFPLAEADATAAALAAAGTPVRVAWFTGGHDGGAGPRSERERVKALTGQWLGHYVAGTHGRPESTFTYSRVAGFAVGERGLVASGYAVDHYPGLAGTTSREVRLAGDPQPAVNPPGGAPAAISAVPGLGDASALAGQVAADPPGQHADFTSAPLTGPVDLAGAPTVSLRVASPTGAATVFVKLYDLPGGGPATLVGGQVAPVRLTGLPADLAAARPVTVTLPGLVHRFEAGHRVRVTVSTTDAAYATPAQPMRYTVALGDGPLTLPDAPGREIATGAAVWGYALAALLALVALGVTAAVLLGRRRGRRAVSAVEAPYADTPLVVRDLRKEYPGGFVAVGRVAFTVGRGQVVGLLGPNGAGKTTTLRVLTGLTRPTAGDALVFGHRLAPGAPVLSRIGALVEGPGFLPHLSGLENLRAYWRATGRPAGEAYLDTALEIAGLGDSVHRRVRTYSHGMKQRLAIAQAMLGLPELLVLDEPTDGLDPPQIAAMRQVLRRYAADGRAVLVSSHLLAEVEQTCTHVVVVHKGAVVASGPVADIVGDSPTTQFGVGDPGAAAKVIGAMVGVVSLELDEAAGLTADLGTVPRGAAVAALVRAGVRVDRVVPRRRLEDAFLSLVGEQTRGSGDR